MNTTNSIKEGVITVFASESVFSKQAILKCLYWYGDKFHTIIEATDKGGYKLTLQPLASAGIKEDEFEFYLQKLERDLIDFQLRETISAETHNIRDLLVAKAFSNGEYDEAPPGDVSDPVGFNPNLTTI